MILWASLPVTVVAAAQQRVVGLVYYVDTGTQAGKEDAALPVAYRVAEHSLSDAPPQSGPKGSHSSQGR